MPQESQHSFWRFNLPFFLLFSFMITTCTTFPTTSNHKDIRVTSLVSHNSESQFNQRISSTLNTASSSGGGWSSVFIPSEFHFVNRKSLINISQFNAPAFESNFNILQGEQRQEESLEDTFLNAIDDISRGLRCHPSYTSRGNKTFNSTNLTKLNFEKETCVKCKMYSFSNSLES